MNKNKIQKLIDKGDLIPFRAKYEAMPEEEKNLVMERVAYYDSLYAIRDAREKLGLSQDQVASKTGLSRATVNRIESGSNNFTYDKLIRIAHAVNLDVNLVPMGKWLAVGENTAQPLGKNISKKVDNILYVD